MFVRTYAGAGGGDHRRQPLGCDGDFAERADLFRDLFVIPPVGAGSVKEKKSAGAERKDGRGGRQ